MHATLRKALSADAGSRVGGWVGGASIDWVFQHLRWPRLRAVSYLRLEVVWIHQCPERLHRALRLCILGLHARQHGAQLRGAQVAAAAHDGAQQRQPPHIGLGALQQAQAEEGMHDAKGQWWHRCPLGCVGMHAWKQWSSPLHGWMGKHAGLCHPMAHGSCAPVAGCDLIQPTEAAPPTPTKLVR